MKLETISPALRLAKEQVVGSSDKADFPFDDLKSLICLSKPEFVLLGVLGTEVGAIQILFGLGVGVKEGFLGIFVGAAFLLTTRVPATSPFGFFDKFAELTSVLREMFFLSAISARRRISSVIKTTINRYFL